MGKTSLFASILNFFTSLLSGSSPEGDAAACKETLIESVAVLERAKAVPGISQEVKDAVAGLARLLFLCINLDPARMAEEKEAVHAVRQFTGKIAKRMRDSQNHSRQEVDALLVEGRELALTLVTILEAGPPEKTKTPDTAVTLRERLAIAETRDMAEALGSLMPRLPASMGAGLDRIRVLTGDILAHCEKTGAGIARECKFLKKYIAGARKIAEGAAAMREEGSGQSDILSRSGDVLGRIASAFESEKKALATRKRDDFAADLTVLDTLLRMDGE